MKVYDLAPGQEGIIEKIEDSNLHCVQRLMTLGLVEGTTIKYIGSVSKKGPIEVEIYGSKLALRKDCASHFIVRKTTMTRKITLKTPDSDRPLEDGVIVRPVLTLKDLEQREDLERKISESNHMSKPDADNATVVYDKDGRWIFEMYTADHEVKEQEQE